MAGNLLLAVTATRKGESLSTRVVGEGGQCSKSTMINISHRNWSRSALLLKELPRFDNSRMSPLLLFSSSSNSSTAQMVESYDNCEAGWNCTV
ncbi:hypothetical protein Dimus_008268 [Dionaea muscipula]